MEVKPYNFTLAIDTIRGNSSEELSGVKNFVPKYDITPNSEQAVKKEELAAAKEIARREGYERGKAEGLELGKSESLEVERRLASVLEILSSRIESFFGEYEKTYSDTSENAIRIAIKTADKVAGDALKNDSISSIEKIVRECFKLIAEEPRVTITLHESLVEEFKRKIESILAEKNFKGKIKITGSPTIQESDCLIEWKNGGCELNISDIWNKIDAIIGQESFEEDVILTKAEILSEEYPQVKPEDSSTQENKVEAEIESESEELENGKRE